MGAAADSPLRWIADNTNPESLTGTLKEAVRGADVFIYDAQFTPDEYESKRGWGHSTWLEAIHVARDAKVKQLVLAHHDPSHSDEFLRNVLAQAREKFDNVVIAQEGLAIPL